MSDEGNSDSNNDVYIHFKENTEIYIILMDDEPYCYCTSLEDARNKMWELVKLKRNIEADDGNSYNYYIIEKNDDEVHLEMSYKYYVISYNNLVSKFSIQGIFEVERVNK